MKSDANLLLEKAKAIVDGSSLPGSDKELLLNRLPYAGTLVLSLFVEVCEDDPFSTEQLVRNLKVKLDAQGNLTKIHDIIKHEQVELEGMLAIA